MTKVRLVVGHLSFVFVACQVGRKGDFTFLRRLGDSARPPLPCSLPAKGLEDWSKLLTSLEKSEPELLR